MPAELQKSLDYTFVGFQNTYCFLDDIIMVSTGSEYVHLSLSLTFLKSSMKLARKSFYDSQKRQLRRNCTSHILFHILH